MKKARHYYTLLILLYLTIISGNLAFSQDSLRIRPNHIIGAEAQVNYNSSLYDAHHRNWVDYNIPGCNLFYGYILPSDKNWKTILSSGFQFRSGKGYDSDGGLGGSHSVSGSFNQLRLYVGIYKQKRYGKKKNFAFGPGINFGYRLFAQGSVDNTNSSGSGTTTQQGNINSALNAAYLAAQLEISQRFKLRTDNYLIIGVKQYLETPDFKGARRHLTSSLFFAYNLR